MAMDPQDQSLHPLWQVLDGADAGVGQFKAMGVSLGGSWFG